MDRLSGLGGSDMASVLNVSPFKSAYRLYLEKTGQLPGRWDDSDEPEWIQLGRLLEPVIAQFYSSKTKRTIVAGSVTDRRGDLQIPRRRVDLPAWATGNIDFFQHDHDRGWGILEIKNVGSFQAEHWADGATPLWYRIQGNHYCWLYDASWYTLCALVGGNRLIWRDIDRNEGVIKGIDLHGTLFWNRVLDRIPPEPTEQDVETMRDLYERAQGERVKVLGPEAIRIDEEYTDALDAIRTQERKRDRAQAAMMSLIADAAVALLPGGQVSYEWKNRADGARVFKRRTR